MMETTISDFRTSFYIAAIQKLAFHITHVQILGTNHCGDSRRNVFKRRESFQHLLCCCDYAERVVASFAHQIQSEYYVGNRYVSVEGVTLEHFSALPWIEINSSTKPFPRHAMFHYFLSDDRKQDAATTTSHSKSSIEILKENNY